MPVPNAALPASNQLIFDDDAICIGVVRCPPGAPDFHDPCTSKCCSLAFSRSAVLIRPAGRRSFVEDPTVVSFYNQGQEYSRGLVAREGDRCEWLGVAPEIVRDAIRPYDPHATDAERDLFRASTAKIPASVYLAQRTLYRAIRRDPSTDRLWIEEMGVAVLAAAVRAMYPGVACVDTMQRRRVRELAEAATHIVAARYMEPLTLDMIAGQIGTSIFQLCRIFRRHHGGTIHRYLVQTRLRRALEALEEGERDLGDLAVRLGFSHHSHFSAAFRNEFSVAPSIIRARLCGTTRRKRRLPART